MRKIWNKGHRIRASDKHLVYHFSIGTLLFVFMCIGRFSVLPLLLRQFQEAPAPSKAGKNDTGK